MICPQCKKHYENDYLYCGDCVDPSGGPVRLVEDIQMESGIGFQFGDAAAVNHLNVSDSHDVTNVDKSVHNITDNSSSTVTNINYAAQKTDAELLQDNENQFIKAVRERVADGLTRQEEAELEQIARDRKINPQRAHQIIEAERKSADILSGGQGNEYYAGKVLQNVYDAVNANQADILKRLFIPLEELSKTMDDGNVQYYYYMLLASMNPAGCTVSFVNHHTDNYWQLFWTCIAYVKLGQVQNAVALIPRLGGFGGPHGDIDLLTAVENLFDFRRTKNDYYHQQMQANLQSAVSGGLSELLNPLWYAVQELAKEKQQPEDWFAFYVETTLKELGPEKEKHMSKDMPQMPTPPSMPKFDPQAVQLKQSRGWNALQAAQQMGLGQMPSMQDMQAQLNAMRNQVMGGVPPMPQATQETDNTIIKKQ